MKGLEQIVDISIDLKAPLITIWVLPILLYYHYTTTILLYYCYYATILCYCYYIVLLCLSGPVEKRKKTYEIHSISQYSNLIEMKRWKVLCVTS